MTAHQRPVVLSIGGLDPAGCAGITADSQIIQQLGGHPYSIASCITVQTETAALQSQATSNGLVAAQLRALCTPTTNLQGAKTGAIQDPRHWFLLKRYLPKNLPLVIDPVLRTSSGLTLAQHQRHWFRGLRHLANRASLITPNAAEWTTLQSHIPNDVPVLVTGATSGDQIQNQLLINGSVTETFTTVLHQGEYRGTGCRLSSAIAFYLASGLPLPEAIRCAMRALDESIRNHYRVGATRIPFQPPTAKH